MCAMDEKQEKNYESWILDGAMELAYQEDQVQGH